MADEDILVQTGNSTQAMIPKLSGNLTSFGPAPMVQPPPIPRMASTEPSTVNQGEFTTKGGRQRADRQALIGNLAHLIKNGGDYVNAKKQRNLTMVIERLIGAQEGLKEAQAANDQEGIKRNSAIINDITSDPKNVKQLQKAFNIDLFGNGKNKNENMALSEAMKNYQREKQSNPNALNPVAQRLQQAQPMREQLSPEAQAQAMAIKSGLLPKAEDILKAYQENFKTIQTAKSAEDRTKAIESRNKIIESNAQLIASAKDKQTQAYLKGIEKRYMSEEDRFATEVKIAKIRASETDKRVQASEDIASGRNKVLEDKITAEKGIAQDKNKTAQERLDAYKEYLKLTHQKNVYGTLSQQIKGLNDYRKTVQTEMEKYQSELDKKGSSFLGFKFNAMSEKDAMAARIRIGTNTRILNDVDAKIQELQSKQDILKITGESLTKDDSGINPNINPSGINPEAGLDKDNPINGEDNSDTTEGDN